MNIEKFESGQSASSIDKGMRLPSERDKVIEIIKEIYAEAFAGDFHMSQPSEKALDFYVDFASQRSMSVGDMYDIVLIGAQTLEKSLNAGSVVKQELPSQVYGTEDDVTLIYNEILFRNPDDTELYNFAKMLQTDSDFTLDKLKQVLYASEEYKRLEKTQTNAVYSNLMGGVTNRQLGLIVAKTYKDVTGLDDLDEETMNFLKKKLISFNLNEDEFKQFLIKYLKNEPFSRVAAEQPAVAKIIPIATNPDVVTKQDMEKWKNEVLQEVKVSLQTQPKGNNTQQGNELGQVNPNRQVIEVLLKTAQNSQNNHSETYLDSQNVMDRIKDEAKCVFDKNAEDNNYKGKSNQETLADRQDKRNTDELRSTCLRNKNFLGVDENMVLDPSLKWSVPQRFPPVCVGGANNYQPVSDQTALIGTLLEDAKATSVGSVLPKIPPR
jgi:hypothetical protein